MLERTKRILACLFDYVRLCDHVCLFGHVWNKDSHCTERRQLIHVRNVVQRDVTSLRMKPSRFPHITVHLANKSPLPVLLQHHQAPSSTVISASFRASNAYSVIACV